MCIAQFGYFLCCDHKGIKMNSLEIQWLDETHNKIHVKLRLQSIE